ncbi:hypothetical protein Pth03_75060 [Planotetraspora thailandica]|uniref:N-acetyltransferase domain-containing protein n=1 Tax=Planotetraspora thailandica TaxID=487172 RepID=A0A8J4DFQ6_9ACTN|nr:GNAT family N-acetyltransferase [Planotetraspora thailandica]GII59117.1 hypothetical protein Pth03_75060 [Planotetraspora thailandica]
MTGSAPGDANGTAFPSGGGAPHGTGHVPGPDLATEGPGPARQASDAAIRSGVRIRELADFSAFKQVVKLFDDIWHPDPSNPALTPDLMRAMSHAGNYLAGAFDGATLVGASAAFFAAPPGRVLHSHVTGTVRRGAGFALKLHQRAWALARGIDVVTWTCDPLVRRNAYFNLAKLGARPEEYLRDFYGSMADLLNAGDESDRVLAVWRLDEPLVAEACAGRPYVPPIPPDAVVGVAEHEGRPRVGATDARVVLVAIPADIESLRRRDAGLARAWRYAVRDVLGTMMTQGARVTGFAEGCYVVERT